MFKKIPFDNFFFFVTISKIINRNPNTTDYLCGKCKYEMNVAYRLKQRCDKLNGYGTSEWKFKCTWCDTGFNDLKSYKVHTIRHSISIQRNIYQLEMHRNSDGSKSASDLKYRIFGFESSPNMAPKNVSTEKNPKQSNEPEVRCQQCKWLFLSAHALASHIEWNHGNLNKDAGR